MSCAADSDNTLDYRDPEWVAGRLGLDRNTVYKYLQDGVIPAARIGHKWLISESQLAGWLAHEVAAQTASRRRAVVSADATIGRLRNFSQTSREVLRAAHAEARTYGHAELGQGHLLLAILTQPELPAARLLLAAGISPARFRGDFEARCPATGNTPPRRLGRTPAAKLAMHLAALRRLESTDGLVPPERLVWGILEAQEGIGCELLSAAGLNADGWDQLQNHERQDLP